MEFSCEYQFEELEIEVNGVFFGCFNGTAELVEDSGYGTFWVKAICLDGQKETNKPSVLRPWRKERESASIALDRPAYGQRPDTLSEHLFDALEKALYRSDAASEFFHAQFAEVAA